MSCLCPYALVCWYTNYCSVNNNIHHLLTPSLLPSSLPLSPPLSLTPTPLSPPGVSVSSSPVTTTITGRRWYVITTVGGSSGEVVANEVESSHCQDTDECVEVHSRAISLPMVLSRPAATLQTSVCCSAVLCSSL